MRRAGMLRSLTRSLTTTSKGSEPPLISREMRAQLRKKTNPKVNPGAKNESSAAAPGRQTHSPIAKIVKLSTATIFIGSGVWFGLMDEETKKTCRNALHASFLGTLHDFIMLQVETMAKPFTDPSREKLLPDWPNGIPGIPPGVPAPPTLVLALEDTLMRSEWDRKHGWRHARRPGLDTFLEKMARHYEIVIFSKQVAGVGEEILEKLDPKQFAMHRLYRDATQYTAGKHVKNISKLNRDESRIIIVETDPESFQLQPRNGIVVKPFLNDVADNTLEELTPFLQAVAMENVRDIPALLDTFRDEDSGLVEDLSAKYKLRCAAVQMKSEVKKAKGLGGLIRNRGSSTAPAVNGAANFKGF